MDIGILQEIGLWIISLLLLSSATFKVLSFGHFRATVLRIPYVPFRLATFISLLVLLAELCAGILLGCNLVAGKLLAIFMFSTFILVTVIVLRRQLRIKCNCFGAPFGADFSLKTIRMN